MAVKKVKSEEEVKVDVEIPQEKEQEVKVETPKEKTPETEVKVDMNAMKKSPRKEGNVRIRMRVDHRCCIAMVRYDLKKGQCYNVPENVKRILGKAGLLDPLN